MGNAYIRFPSVAINADSTIESAIITFVAYEDSPTGVCNLALYFEDADNPSTISDASDYDSRSLTNAVEWLNVPIMYDGVSYRTPELNGIMQTVINRSGWASGNAVILFIKDNGSRLDGTRSFSSGDYLSAAEAPVLNVTWGDYPTGTVFYTSSVAVGLDIAGSDIAQFDHCVPVQLGVIPPSSVPTLVEGAAGNPNGAYYYKVTYVNNAGFEGNASSASAQITVTSKKIEVSAIPVSTDLQVKQRRLYRTQAGGATYYRVVTIDNNYETTYSDDVADANLSVELSTDHDVPPVFSSIQEHNSLLWGVEAARKNVLWYCKQFDQWEYFPSTNYEPFGAGLESTQAITTLGEFLTIVQKDKIWNYNTKEDPEEKAKSFSDKGILNLGSAFNIGEALLMADLSGIYLFDTIRDLTISTAIEQLFDFYGDHEYRIDQNYGANTRVAFLDRLAFISYTSQGNTVNNRTIVYNIEARVFEGVMSMGFKAFAVDREGKNVYGVGEDNRIYYLRSSDQDNDSDILWNFTTKDIARELGSPQLKKEGDFAKVDCDPSGGTITTEVYYDGALVQTRNMSGSSRSVYRFRLFIDKGFYRINFKFSGSGKQKIHGLSVQAKLMDF